MCPAPAYSYFDAQLLADFIMNSQFPGYDGTNTTAASSDSGFGQLGNIGAGFAGATADDYDSYDNARARKRRLTVSDDRRVEDLSSFNIPDVSDGLFSMLDQHHGYSGAMQQQQHQHQQNVGGHMTSGSSALSSLPIPPGTSDDSSLSATLVSGGMTFNGLPFPPNPYASSSSGDIGSPHHLHHHHQHHQHGNPLSSPPTSNRALVAASASSGARKHQSLSIAINRGHPRSSNELIHGQEPHTPGMFSPSFMDAMDGAAAAMAAGMSSPSMFYSVGSPYTPIHAHHHHHSFSMPSGGGGGAHHQGQGAGGGGGMFLDHSSTSSGSPATTAAAAAAAVAAAAISHSLGSVGSADDFSAGLQISMNAAVAAAMSNSSSSTGAYDDGSAHHHHRSGSSASSAFSRVQAQQAQAQAQQGAGMDIGSTLASFGSMAGLDAFPAASLERRQTFASGDHYHHGATPFGLLATSMALTAAMAGGGGGDAAALHGALAAHDALAASPALDASPAAARRARKRAATVASMRTEAHGMAGLERGVAGSDVAAAPAFNSQAVVAGTGSKVVMVLTSKVAQKSYGTEKRFLCPPPTILLFGDAWQLEDRGGGGSSGSSNSSDFVAAMPRISVAVPASDEANADAAGGALADAAPPKGTAQLEWIARPDPAPKPRQHVPHAAATAAAAAQRAPRDGEPITGRYVAKQLFINDVDEKRKRVAVRVRLHDPSGRAVLGEFESRPIKVISKPSKKRQSVKNIDLCIHHGSTISLFNRLRSQTVSTKYLGATRSMSVGGPRPFWFPAGGDDTNANAAATTATTFVARNAVWDPFIVWIVNTQLAQPEIDAFNARIADNPTPIPGYPTPPTFALHPQCPPDLDGASGGGGGGGACACTGSCSCSYGGGGGGGEPIPILYNQPVILQCVSTGMCSPVLTLRKVEKGSVAVGSFYGRDHSRDVLGDPVSQLHKVAFEVRVQTRDELPAVTVTPAGLNTRVGSYLTCMGDIVGLNATCDGRQLTGDAQAPAHDGKAGGARKQHKDGASAGAAAASAGTTSWAEDVGDNAVWTMVGTDCAIYRFDYPPESEILAQLQQQTAPASSSARSMAMPLHSSMTLPPTPTSPHGVQDYVQQQQQQQQSSFSLEMMLAEHGSGGFPPVVGMDASLAAAVYGIPSHFLSSSSSAAAAAAASEQQPISSMLAAAAAAAGRSQQQQQQQQHAICSNSTVPIVFKSAVQNPPTINPSTLFGRECGGLGGAVAPTERSYITLHGLNFTPDMVVVFDGAQQSLFTEFKSSESISCLGPLASDFGGNNNSCNNNNSNSCSSSTEDDGDYHMQLQLQLQHPTSPSESDSSTAGSSNAHNSDDALRPFASLISEECNASKPRSQRASSTDSTATLGSPLPKGPATTSAIKVPIYLSRNGGAGPTFKTGQFFTVHL